MHPAEIAQSPRLGFWLTCLAVFIGVSTLVRLGLGLWVAAAGGWSWDLVAALPIGLAGDAAIAIGLGVPFLAGLYLLGFVWRRRAGAWLGHLMLLALLGVLVFSAVSEFFFWEEFDARFNGVAVNYLMFPREVVGNIRESFDLRLILPPIALAALAAYWPLRRPLSRALAAPRAAGEGRRALALGALALALAAPVLYLGPLSASENRQANEVAANGLHSLLRAALTNDAKYDGHYAGLADAEAWPLLRALVAQDNTAFVAPAPAPTLRRRVTHPGPAKRLNVVLVINESFGSTYVDSLDNRRGVSITPRIDGLARDGLLFTNIYATGDRTVRGLEALLTSFAPIPGISTARRSGSEGMNSLPFLLKQFGYRSAFLYAGEKSFDNMGHYWSTIGFDEVWDEDDFVERGFSTIWGHADEHLYAEALRRIDRLAAGGPFLLGLLTVTNHRPFTFPPGRIDDTQTRQIGRREAAAQYADWAYGEFVERARSRPWFDDTVFIFVGDHGPRVFGAQRVPVDKFRVPLLFYAPKHIGAERNPTLGSQLDMAPTLLGLMGLSYDSPFFGLDLRRVPPGGGRIAMAHNYSIAFGAGGHLVVLEPNRTVKAFGFEPGPTPPVALPQPDPEVLRRAVAQTQTAHRLFYARGYHELSAAQ